MNWVWVAVLIATATQCVSSASPVVTWASVPVEPGHHMLLAVVGMTNSTLIEAQQDGGQWIPLSVNGVTDYGCAVTVPTTFNAGPFLVRASNSLKDTKAPMTPFQVNVVQPWFAFGDRGSSSSPGGWLRIVGEAVTVTQNVGVAPVLMLTMAGNVKTISARMSTSGDGIGAKLTRWHAFFDIPSSFSEGTYTLQISNDGESYVPLCTFVTPDTPCLTSWQIQTPPQWPRDVFTVNSTQPGPARNATEAVQSAIHAASMNGGGIVYFPRGQYFVKGPLLVPANTLLKGESKEVVAIYFEEEDTSTAPPAYITSQGAVSWGMEGLTLFVTSYANNVVQFQPGTDGAFMRGCRIRYNSYFCLEPDTSASSRGRKAGWLYAAGTAVMLAGTNLFVTDNDIYSSGDVVSTKNNGAAGADYMHIARNRFWNGGTTHWGISWKQCIYEDNVATGVSTTAMGSNYPQYAHNSGLPHVQNIYHHNNSQNMVWGNDREMMTCDGGGGVYYGPATSSGTHVSLPTAASNSQPGGALCVLKGTGTGECRRVVSNAAGNASFANGVPLYATDCAAAPGWTLPTASSGLISSKAITNLTICTCCDSTCGSVYGTDKCGAEPFPEPVVIGYNDSFTTQYQTNIFMVHNKLSSSIRLQLLKSGKCLGQKLSGETAAVACNDTDYYTNWTVLSDGRLQSPNLKCLGVKPTSNLQSWVVDRPFSVDLDSTSYVTIMPFVGHIAFNGNEYQDGGEVQFYAQALGVVAAENNFARMGGLSAWARGYSGKNANLCNSFIENTIEEGNHVWNYNTHPNPIEDPTTYPYFPGGSKTIEPWSFASLTNEQGPPIDPKPSTGFDGAFNRFITFRGNKVNSNGGIVVRGTSANVLVENNIIANSDVGIHVNYTTTQGGIVLKNNTEPSGVPENYNPYANQN
eukprot:m.8277 g.8277  ORF g.8277 m.8277 type:complete len:915 (-) comp3864_c0_seq1:40-2784(-)